MALSPSVIPYAQSSSSDITFLALLTFTIPSQPAVAPVRVVNNTVNIMSRGLEFQAYPFNVVLPQDTQDTLPTVALEIDNVSPDIMVMVRGFPEPPNLLLEIITNVNYDVVERAVGYLKLTSVDYDTFKIRGTLQVDNVLSRRFPADIYDPVQFPGLFAL